MNRNINNTAAQAAKRSALTLLLGLLLFLSMTLPQAKADAEFDKQAKELKLLPDDQSIYKINFWTDSAIIIGGTVLFLEANAFQYNIIQRRCPCNPEEINFIDRPNVANESKTANIISNYTVTAALIAPIVIDYLDVGLTKSFAEDMMIYTEVLAVNFGLVTIAKFATQRPYPFQYNKKPGPHFGDASDYLSFYSSHTSTTVAALTAASVTLNLRHGKTVWPWIVTGVLGTSIAIELVASGEHFTTDVIVGAAMGLAVGIVVPGLHAKDKNWLKNIHFFASEGTPGLMWSYNY